MTLTTRNSVTILLINEHDQLLLMCADNPKTTSIDGTYHGRFWFPIGGKIEKGESMQEAALREIHEETGITADQVELGPIVWFGEFDLVLGGIPTNIKQTFIVAKTKQNRISLDYLTDEERAVIKKIAWFSLDDIKSSTEVIYPIVLPKYLPNIISENYPKHPLEIDLGKQPS